MKLLRTIDEMLNKLEGGLLILFLAVMVVLAFAQVVLRNAFSAGILWADILLRHLVLWTGFFGAALAASKNRHINIDVLTRFLPERVKSGINILTNLFAATICALLMQAAITFVRQEMADGNVVIEGIPSWYAELIIPVGFGLLVFHFLVRAVVSAGELWEKGETR